MDHGAVSYYVDRQKKFILNLISQGKFQEAQASLDTVKELWYALEGMFNYNKLKNAISKANELKVTESRKSFAEEVRITGR